MVKTRVTQSCTEGCTRNYSLLGVLFGSYRLMLVSGTDEIFVTDGKIRLGLLYLCLECGLIADYDFEVVDTEKERG